MAKEIDLLAGTKRQSAYSEALLRNALSAKPAYGGIGEALARAMLGGMAGHFENQDSKENAKAWGELAEAYLAGQPSGSGVAPATPGAPAAPRLPAIGSAQDMTPVSQVPNERVAAAFDGLQAPQQPDYGSAIAKIESGGAYDKLGPVTKTGDRAHGKYQVMGANIGPWTTAHLGRAMTPDEFLRDPKAQDAVFNGQFGQYVQKHGPEGAARAWFAGEGGMNDPNRRDQLGTSVADYAAKFNQNVGQAGQAYAQGNNPQREAILDAIRNPRTSNEMRARLFQMLQKAPAEFKTIKDADGNETPVWVNPQTQQITRAQVPGGSQQPQGVTMPDGRVLTPPPGTNAKEFRKSVTSNLADALSGKLTETQANATTFANRMEAAEVNARKFEFGGWRLLGQHIARNNGREVFASPPRHDQLGNKQGI